MDAYFAIFWVCLFGAGIFVLRAIVPTIKKRAHPNRSLDQAIKFQAYQLLLALGCLYGVDYLVPNRLLPTFGWGDLAKQVQPIAWLGITGQESWAEIALTLGISISLGTALFMYFQLRGAGVRPTALLPWLGWAVLFSAANAFSEEAIFRLGIVLPLRWVWPAATIALISGVIFGLPHWFGMPSGPVGALMAGFMGWFLALSLLETGGLGVAWTIHFAQDVIIISSMLAMQNNIPGTNPEPSIPNREPRGLAG